MTKEKLLQDADVVIEGIFEFVKRRMRDIVCEAFEEGKKHADTDKAEEFAKEIVDRAKGMLDEIKKQSQTILVTPPVITQPQTTPTWPYQPIPPFTCDASKGDVPEAHFDGGDTDGDNDN